MADEDAEALRYFQSLEEAFIRLRGAPLLLSPKDWQVAQRWRAAAIPLDFAIAAMTELFARRRERGAEGRVSSLAYCARAVESAWRQVEELAGPTRRTDARGLDSAARLEALARALPPDLPNREWVAQAVLGLRGDAAEIEAGLIALDDAMLAAAAARLDDEEKASLESWVERRLDAMRDRLDEAELTSGAHRLRSRELRRRAALPLLSLFSKDAEKVAESLPDPAPEIRLLPVSAVELTSSRGAGVRVPCRRLPRGAAR